MIPLVAALVALACAAASARRVWFAANATALDPADIERALAAAGRGEGDRDGPEAAAAFEELSALVAREPTADWERDLLQALAAPAPLRVALVNEQMTELDYRIQRWSRVPRVCASIASSFAFMMATLVLRQGLAAADDLSGDLGELLVRGLVGDAFTVAAVGMIGTAFCIAAQGEAKRIAKGRVAAADRLVERLEGGGDGENRKQAMPDAGRGMSDG